MVQVWRRASRIRLGARKPLGNIGHVHNSEESSAAYCAEVNFPACQIREDGGEPSLIKHSIAFPRLARKSSGETLRSSMRMTAGIWPWSSKKYAVSRAAS